MAGNEAEPSPTGRPRRKTSSEAFRAVPQSIFGPATRTPPPEELVSYTFEALQAWCVGYGLPRQDEGNPTSNSRALDPILPEFHPIQSTVRTYSRYAYGSRSPRTEDLNSIRQLWALMTAHPMTSRN